MNKKKIITILAAGAAVGVGVNLLLKTAKGKELKNKVIDPVADSGNKAMKTILRKLFNKPE